MLSLSPLAVGVAVAPPLAAPAGAGVLPATSSGTRASGVLLADSCPSASWCMAVGGSSAVFEGDSAIAESWNGRTMSAETVPMPAGGQVDNLTGVSCTSPSFCFAVGSWYNGTVTHTLAAVWNGTTWSVKRTPYPSGSQGDALSAVSCVSSTWCTAVGAYLVASSSEQSLAERWNGQKWSIVATLHSSKLLAAILTSVSCSSGTWCVAVGVEVTSSGVEKLVAARWNGTAWATVSVPNPYGFHASQLNGVSCTSPTWCAAVGTYTTGSSAPPLALAERWNGSKWSLRSAPNPSTSSNTTLNAVSCLSATWCLAAGTYQTTTVKKTLAEIWNGSRWSVKSSPNLSSPEGNSFNGVSCRKKAFCIAVGAYTNSASVATTLPERWDGTDWSILS